jgi:DNA-binding winged helix-turn-helix (wHTH) protein
MRDTRVLEFGPFRLDLGVERLWREAEAVRLTAKAFAVPCPLVVHAGHLVTRDELIEVVRVLPYMSEAALSWALAKFAAPWGMPRRRRQFHVIPPGFPCF